MCAQKWAEINFIKVSSMCLDRHKRVFLNEGKDRVRVNLDHLACRKHLLEMIAEKEGRERLEKPGRIYKKGCWCGERLRAKAGGDEILAHTLKGKQLFPHDLVLSAGAQTEEGTSPTLSAQFSTFSGRPCGEACLKWSRRAKLSRPKRPCSWTASVAIDSAKSQSCSRAQACKFTDTCSNLLHPVGRDGRGVHHAG